MAASTNTLPNTDRTSQSTADDRWKWSQMKYTVIQEEERVDVNITRNGRLPPVRLRNRHTVDCSNGNEWIVDLGQVQSAWLWHRGGDRTEYIYGINGSYSVYDTRKLALQTDGFG